MSEDVRKNLRTQGKYSDGKVQKNRDKKQRSSPVAKDSFDTRLPKKDSVGSRSINTSLSDENVSSLKYEEHSDYSFHELEEVAKPEEIKSRGEFILSKTEYGESRIFYEPRFLHDDEGYEYFHRIQSTINWNRKNIIIHGIEYPQPRLVAWFGPFPYSYSGTTLEPAEMSDVVMEIKEKVETCLKCHGIEATFNSVLINLYRNGKDSVSWHSDDESTMGISPTIASVSLGETRKFEVRRKIRNYENQSPSDRTCKYFVHLTHGSLIVMTGCMQDDWQHRIPKEYHDKEARINLTFRTVYPLERAPVKKFNPETEIKMSGGYNSSSRSSNSNYKFDDEQFPSLQKDVISAKANVTCDISVNLKYSSFKNDDTAEENWDDEISDNEQNVVTHKNNFKVGEDFKLKNNGQNNFNNEEPSEKWCNIESNYDNEKIPLDDKTATKKLWYEESPGSDFQENNTVEERYKSINDASPNEIEGNKFYKKIDIKEAYDRDAHLTANNTRQNVISEEEISVKSCNVKTNSCVNVIQENDIENEKSPNLYHDVINNSWAGSLEENNLDAKKTEKQLLNVDAKVFTNSFTNVTEENDLGNIKPPNTCQYVETSSRINSSEENNLSLKQPGKMTLNVDAKEFIPNTVKSNIVSEYSELKLEDLIYCDVNSLQGKNLQDHAQHLKIQVLERFHEINRFERKDLEFLLEITDGSQVDKNQRLITMQICRLVQNNLLKNRLPPNVQSSFDRSSRHRGYENQSYYSDKGKRYPNQNRNSRHNRNRF